ncbi:MAG TPA: hypothetical protein PKD34_02115 [Candidatus Doudnabacteria bacterium]|nr:hypothetical protein [Candidatus Doudnabacteria bacterium]
MNEVICYNKRVGQTPLEAIEELRTKRPELSDKSITYAGRLDPMADGLLLLLVGHAVHRKDELSSLSKTYRAKILLGVGSDSYDILGLVATKEFKQPSELEINQAVTALVGQHQFPYPAFSSKPVNGKPLWQWMKEGKLPEITIPTREMNVLSAELFGSEFLDWLEIYEYATTSIAKISGDFRQSDAISSWKNLDGATGAGQKFMIVEVNFDVTSGTYIRTLAHELGKSLHCPALLYQLTRTSIGEYKI